MSIETQRERVAYLQNAIREAEKAKAALDPRTSDYHAYADISQRIVYYAKELRRLGGHLP
jgi:hypothetical protein